VSTVADLTYQFELPQKRNWLTVFAAGAIRGLGSLVFQRWWTGSLYSHAE